MRYGNAVMSNTIYVFQTLSNATSSTLTTVRGWLTGEDDTPPAGVRDPRRPFPGEPGAGARLAITDFDDDLRLLADHDEPVEG